MNNFKNHQIKQTLMNQKRNFKFEFFAYIFIIFRLYLYTVVNINIKFYSKLIF